MSKKQTGNALNYVLTLGFTFVQILALTSLGNIGAFAAENTANLIIGRKDLGNTVELSTCVQSTGTNVIKLADVSTWFDLTNFTTTPTITEEGKFTAASGFYEPVFQEVSAAIGTEPAIWSQRLTYTGNNTTGGLEISTTPELFMKNTLTKSGANPTVALHVDPGAEWFTVVGGLPITFTTTYVNTDCRVSAVIAPNLGTNPTGMLTGTVGQQTAGTITTTGGTYTGPANYVNGECVISGNIANSIFTPTTGQLILASCPTGLLNSGTLIAGTRDNFSTITGVASNFTAAVVASKTLGTNPIGVLTGTIGQPVTGTITTTGGTYFGSAQYVNGACIINGAIGMGGIFTPTLGQVIPANCPTGALTSGTLNATGITTLPGVATNFVAAIVIKTPLTLDDLKTTDLKCNDGKNVIKNSTTTCTFLLPANKTLPTDLKLAIGDAMPAGVCTLNGLIVTCTNVPTGSLTGKQPIISQLGTGAKADTTKTTMVDNLVIAIANTGASTTSTTSKPTTVSTVKTLSKTGANSIFLIAGSMALTFGGIAMISLRKLFRK